MVSVLKVGSKNVSYSISFFLSQLLPSINHDSYLPAVSSREIASDKEKRITQTRGQTLLNENVYLKS